jgi:hypothetical protein
VKTVATSLALFLVQSKGLFGKLCRAVFFMPYAIPTAIGASIWGYTYSPNLRPSTSLSGTNRLPFAGPGPVLDRVKNTRLEGEGKAGSRLDRLVQIRERR